MLDGLQVLGPGIDQCITPDGGCDPDGPPYDPQCLVGDYYYFHGNQFERVQSPEVAIAESPWRHIGRVFSASSGTAGGATGTLIAPGFVLTAAHAVWFLQWFTGVGFSLTQCGPSCLPYGSVSANTVWVPNEFLAGQPGPSADDQRYWRSFDYAILRLSAPDLKAHSLNDVPDPEPMPLGTVDDTTDFGPFVARATGYVCGRDPPTLLPGQCRDDLWLYQTMANASISEVLMWAGGSGTLIMDVEATARMSGCPVWVSVLGVPIQVGVMTGSNCNAAQGTDDENWAAALTPEARDRIEAVITNSGHPLMTANSPNSGGLDCPEFAACGSGVGFVFQEQCAGLPIKLGGFTGGG